MLALVAWSSDVLPPLPGWLPDAGEAASTRPEQEPASPEVEVEAEVEAEVEPVPEPPTPDTTAPEETPEPPLSEDAPDPVARQLVNAFKLESPAVRPHIASVVAGQLVGDETPELVVGLGDRVDILQIEGGTPRRIATIRIEQAEPAFVPSTPRVAIGDVSGDGRADLLVPYWRRTVGGGSRGGGAVILRGKADGRLDRPRRFAGPRMMVSSIALMNLDERGGLDIVLGGRGRPYGDIPGRLAFYRGARMPRLIREVRTDITEIRFVFPVDIDEDADRDLLVVGNRIVRFRRTSRDRFEPLEDSQRGILFADTPHALSYAVPGSERREALVLATGDDATIVVNEEGMERVDDSFTRGRQDVRLSWVRALVPERHGAGREVLAIDYVTHAWVLGRLDAQGEPVELHELHGGHPRSGVDGVLIEEDDELIVYGLETQWSPETEEVTWQVLRFPFCACEYERPETLDIVDADSFEEWSIR